MLPPEKTTRPTDRILRALILVLLANYSTQNNQIEANPINAADLSIGLSSGMSTEATMEVDTRKQQTSEIMKQIMSDQFEEDFRLSIDLMHRFSAALEAFIRGEHLESKVHDGANVISSWAAANKLATSQTIVKELDFVVSTYWTQFGPLVQKIVAERPSNLGPHDLDFRCNMRRDELWTLRTLGEKSSLYSIYLDTFLSEFYAHCLLRKVAVVKVKNIKPSPLVRQFVDIYLNLPTMNPIEAKSKSAQEKANNLLVNGRALNFNLQEAMISIGPLSKAAKLVFDPRTFLSMTPDETHLENMIQEFGRDCQKLNLELDSVWDDKFNQLVGVLSTKTTNFEDLNRTIKFVSPHLVYGTICQQLMQLH